MVRRTVDTNSLWLKSVPSVGEQPLRTRYRGTACKARTIATSHMRRQLRSFTSRTEALWLAWNGLT